MKVNMMMKAKIITLNIKIQNQNKTKIKNALVLRLADGLMMNKSYSLKHWDFMVKIGQWFKDMLNLGMSQISELMHKNFLWNWLRL